MTYRTIEVSGEGTHLSLKRHQILVEKNGKPAGQFNAAETGLLIIDTSHASYTHPVVSELLDHGAVIVFCGADHLPVGMALPTNGHHLQAERFRAQVLASEPRTKGIWKQLVQEKIWHQRVVCENPVTQTRLERLAKRVRSGDPENIEAQAARAYWQVWQPDTDFRREREGPWPNPLLNYGYMAFRAAVARALCGAGFHCAYGINHSNRYNAFCLADDFVEPFRPLVDDRVRELVRRGHTEIDRECKQELLSLLNAPFLSKAGTGPFINALQRMVTSFHQVLIGEAKSLEIPKPHSSLYYGRGTPYSKERPNDEGDADDDEETEDERKSIDNGVQDCVDNGDV